MKLHVVHRSVAGYAREDPTTSSVIGAYMDAELAKQVALICHGRVAEVTLDDVPLGLAKELRLFFGDKHVAHVQN